MTDLSIFVFGAVATIIVAIALGLLVWAAIEDGRRQRETEEPVDPSP